MELSLILEIIATITGITCVYLQTEEKVLAWPFGLVSVTILSYIFFTQQLYSTFILHIIFAILNVYGWYHWMSNKVSEEDEAPILRLSKTGWIIGGIVVIMCTLSLGYYMANYVKADLPYLDAFTTAGSLVAQFLLARKYIENWTFWIFIDLVALNIYLYKGIYLVAFLFFIYVLLSIKGRIDWKKRYYQVDERPL